MPELVVTGGLSVLCPLPGCPPEEMQVQPSLASQQPDVVASEAGTTNFAQMQQQQQKPQDPLAQRQQHHKRSTALCLRPGLALAAGF